MEGWQIALVVLVAVLVGALLPLIFQLYGTVHTLRALVEKSAKDVDAGVASIQRTADRVDRLGAALEKDGKMATLVDGAASAAQMVNQIRGTMQAAGPIAAAVVTAVMAGVRAWKGAMKEDSPPANPDDPPAAQGFPHERQGGIR